LPPEGAVLAHPNGADAGAARGHKVSLIPSGCCGMAGSFGYETEHFDLSQQIANWCSSRCPRRSADTLVAAPGTSCRHQIQDATGVPPCIRWRSPRGFTLTPKAAFLIEAA